MEGNEFWSMCAKKCSYVAGGHRGTLSFGGMTRLPEIDINWMYNQNILGTLPENDLGGSWFAKRPCLFGICDDDE